MTPPTPESPSPRRQALDPADHLAQRGPAPLLAPTTSDRLPHPADIRPGRTRRRPARMGRVRRVSRRQHPQDLERPRLPPPGPRPAADPPGARRLPRLQMADHPPVPQANPSSPPCKWSWAWLCPSTAGLLTPRLAPRLPATPLGSVVQGAVDHGVVIRREELSDAEWGLIRPLLPSLFWGAHGSMTGVASLPAEEGLGLAIANRLRRDEGPGPLRDRHRRRSVGLLGRPPDAPTGGSPPARSAGPCL